MTAEQHGARWRDRRSFGCRSGSPDRWSCRFEKVAMEQFGDVLDGVVLTHGDLERAIVHAHGEWAVERIRQLNDDVAHRLRGWDGREHGVEPATGKGLARAHVRRVEVVGVLLLQREGQRGRTNPRHGDHEDGRTTHIVIEQRTVGGRIGKMPE
jgi:hypothetical protein